MYIVVEISKTLLIHQLTDTNGVWKKKNDIRHLVLQQPPSITNDWYANITILLNMQQ